MISEREIIRDTLGEWLRRSSNYQVVLIGEYSIRLRSVGWHESTSVVELSNLPFFSVDFDEAQVVLMMHRATGDRLLAVVDYADPVLLDRLLQVLTEVGVCLPASYSSGI